MTTSTCAEKELEESHPRPRRADRQGVRPQGIRTARGLGSAAQGDTEPAWDWERTRHERRHVAERRDRDDFSEYGSLFDDAEPTQNIDEVRGKKAKKRAGSPRRSRSAPATPATSRTGPIRPRVRCGSTSRMVSTTTSSTCGRRSRPSRRCGRTTSRSRPKRRPATDNSGSSAVTDDPSKVSGQHRRVSGESEVVTREPSRITIGTDPSGIPRRPPTSRRRGAPPPSSARAPPRRRPSRARHAGRDRGRPAAGGGVPRRADVRALDAGGADLHRGRPRRRGVLRQGVREGLPAGGDPGRRRLRGHTGRRLLAR